MACPDCFRGGKAVGDPKGTIQQLYGHTTYVAGPAPTSPSGSTIIFITDAFGLGLVNNKLLADDYASATGFRVLVPDIIPGGPVSTSVLEMIDVTMTPVPLLDVWGQANRAYNLFSLLTHVLPWLYRAAPHYSVCVASCLAYARKVRTDMPEGAKLGVAGFCWGGYQSLKLCTQPAVEGGPDGLIDAQFCAHPSGVALPDDIVNAVTKFKTPVSVAHAGHDVTLPTKKMEETEAKLRQDAGTGEGENGLHYHVKTYPGVGHGFSVRAKPGSEDEASGADEAKAQAIEWFKRWL